ncbi:hypothetical protein KFE25_008864 [Diacronema lutheri]|uniref:Trimethylguanosine synthase n=1 Tax=Diacronema lutheri TaxID=2081491 RepID=A0A8J5XRM2_DIALT|nr:hypothetical protein KFE25_008864 [Diacronema lutheri]
MRRQWRTTARLVDCGLVDDDDEEEEEEEEEEGSHDGGAVGVEQSPVIRRAAEAHSVHDAPTQLSSARQRLRTLAIWQQVEGCRVDLALRDGARVCARLRASDARQERLYVAALETPIGTYRQAVVHTSDLLCVELGGDWILRQPRAGASIQSLPSSDAQDAALLGAALDRSAVRPAVPSDAAVAGKYWAQRRSLFSKYALGVKLDAEGWFSVTPERLARHIAARCQCDLVLDPFAGAGGNAIQFAFTCERVLAIDLDLPRLLLAQHNARIYGVADRIEFVHGDFTALAPRLRADVVFLSPPWGGPGYQAASEFDVRTMMGGLNGFALLELALGISPHVAYYLPRNTARQQLAAMALAQRGEYSGALEVESCVLNGRLKALVAYFGELASASSTVTPD